MYHNGNKQFGFVPFKKCGKGAYYERLEFTKNDYLPNCKMCFNLQEIGYVLLVGDSNKSEFWNHLKNYCEQQGFCWGCEY